MPKNRFLHIALSVLALSVLALPAPAQGKAGRHAIEAGLARLKAAPPRGEWSFAVLGDSRGGMNVLEAALAKVEQLEPSFSLFTGDMVGASTDDQWRDARKVLDSTIRDVPVFPVVGNHEVEGAGIRMFIDVFGNPSDNPGAPIDYAFDYGGARFIMMDNSRGGSDEGFSKAQMDWLERKLEGAPPLRFVAAHKPPWTDKWKHAFGNNAKAFMAMCEKHRVTAALFGHIHFYDRFEQNGVTYMIAGGAGAPLYHWNGDPDVGNREIFESPRGVKAHNLATVTVSGGSARFQVYTDQAKLAKVRPARSSGLALSAADFLPWDSGRFQDAVTAGKPVGDLRGNLRGNPKGKPVPAGR